MKNIDMEIIQFVSNEIFNRECELLGYDYEEYKDWDRLNTGKECSILKDAFPDIKTVVILVRKNE